MNTAIKHYDPTALNFRFVKGKNIIARFIEWRTWGDWSHVEFVVPEGYLGARWGSGVAIRPVNYDAGTFADEMFLKLPMNPEQLSKANAFMRNQIGKKYDWLGDLGFMVREDWIMVNRWFCSHYCYATTVEGGIDVLRTKRPYRVSPTLLSTSRLLIDF